MLTKLRIQNFKCLRDTGQLDIRPLTFLVGPNSSGKSGIVQVLRMLQQTAFRAGIVGGPLATSGPFISAGAYPDFIFRHELQRELGVQTECSRVTIPGGEVPGPMRFSVIFGYDRSTTQIRLKASEFDFAERCGQNLHEMSRGTYAGEAWAIVEGRRLTKDLRGSVPVGLFVEYVDLPGVPSELSVGLRPGQFFGFHHGALVAHVGPLRMDPKPSHPMTGRAPFGVGSTGESTFEVLWADNQSSDGEAGRLLRKATEWLGRLAIADTIRLDRLGESNQYEVVVTDPATKTEVSFSEIGFGASQVLPIVVQSFSAMPGSTVLFEQPEIHLHPRAQAELGDLFIEAMQGDDRAFIIETHSEHILARIRRRIAERKPGLTREKVAIYYFKPTPDGTQIEEVTLNDDGQYVDFPPGFFEEDVDEAFEHLRAMSEHA